MAKDTGNPRILPGVLMRGVGKSSCLLLANAHTCIRSYFAAVARVDKPAGRDKLNIYLGKNLPENPLDSRPEHRSVLTRTV